MNGSPKINRRATCQNKSAGQQQIIMNLFDYQLAEIEVSYSHRVPARERFKINSSGDGYNVVQQFWPQFDYVEYFYVIYLNRANHVLGFHQISKGGINATIIDNQVILAIALKTLSKSIICVHNHPSGNLTPSDADIKITRSLKNAATIMGISLLDHLIVTSDSYHSMADNGEM